MHLTSGEKETDRVVREKVAARPFCSRRGNGNEQVRRPCNEATKQSR